MTARAARATFAILAFLGRSELFAFMPQPPTLGLRVSGEISLPCSGFELSAARVSGAAGSLPLGKPGANIFQFLVELKDCKVLGSSYHCDAQIPLDPSYKGEYIVLINVLVETNLVSSGSLAGRAKKTEVLEFKTTPPGGDFILMKTLDVPAQITERRYAGEAELRPADGYILIGPGSVGVGEVGLEHQSLGAAEGQCAHIYEPTVLKASCGFGFQYGPDFQGWHSVSVVGQAFADQALGIGSLGPVRLAGKADPWKVDECAPYLLPMSGGVLSPS